LAERRLSPLHPSTEQDDPVQNGSNFWHRRRQQRTHAENRSHDETASNPLPVQLTCAHAQTAKMITLIGRGNAYVAMPDLRGRRLEQNRAPSELAGGTFFRRKVQINQREISVVAPVEGPIESKAINSLRRSTFARARLEAHIESQDAFSR